MSEVTELVEAAVPAVVEEIKKAEVAVRVDITDAEKLVIRTVENEYLKAQMEIRRLSDVAVNAQRQFTSTVESLVKKYAVDPVVHVFDAVELAFKKR